MLFPFAFDRVEDLLLKKVSEVISRNTDVYLVVDRNGHSDAITLSGAKATRKHDIVLYMMLLYCALKKLNDLLRALEMAGRADTDLYEQHTSQILARTSFAKNSSTVSGVTE